jgi:HNH endonuclease
MGHHQPYHFNAVIGRPQIIHVNSKWLTFFQSNHLPLKLSPNFLWPGISRHGTRVYLGSLTNSKDLVRGSWKKRVTFGIRFLEHQEIRCIYSGELIRRDYDLDHFSPWSFVTHDLIWNLTPAPRAINIQK